MLPEDAVDDLAVTHNQLAIIYRRAGKVERVLGHHREAIRYREMQGNFYRAGVTRRNAAIALAGAGRFGDALEYARAALSNFEGYGERAAEMIEKAKELIGKIEKDLKAQG